MLDDGGRLRADDAHDTSDATVPAEGLGLPLAFWVGGAGLASRARFASDLRRKL
jgi:hypothetical protein